MQFRDQTFNGGGGGGVNIFGAGQKGGSSKFGHAFGEGHIFLLQSISIAEMQNFLCNTADIKC